MILANPGIALSSSNLKIVDAKEVVSALKWQLWNTLEPDVQMNGSD
jgi:hypothetical protein